MTLSRTDGRRLALLTCLFLVASLFVRAFVRHLLLARGLPGPAATDLGAAGGLVFLAVTASPLFRRFGLRIGACFRRSRSLTASLLIGVGAGLACRALDWVLLLSGGVAPGGTVLVSIACTAPPAAGLMVRVIGVPLAEELAHRGLLLQALTPFGMLPAVLLTALVFAALHDEYLMPFIFGLVAAGLALQSGTLWMPITAHAVFNLLSLLEAACLDIAASVPHDSLLGPWAAAALSATLLAVLGGLVCVAGTGTGSRPGAPELNP